MVPAGNVKRKTVSPSMRKASALGLVLPTIFGVLLLYIFSTGRAETAEQFRTLFTRIWIFLAPWCAVTLFCWMLLFFSPKKSVVISLIAYLLVGAIFSGYQLSVREVREVAEETQDS